MVFIYLFITDLLLSTTTSDRCVLCWCSLDIVDLIFLLLRGGRATFLWINILGIHGEYRVSFHLETIYVEGFGWNK